MQTGKITAENRIHDADIKDMRFSQDGTHFITASGDRTSKIVDAQDLQVMKEFAFERPANAADMSPIADHVSICAPDVFWLWHKDYTVQSDPHTCHSLDVLSMIALEQAATLPFLCAFLVFA